MIVVFPVLWKVYNLAMGASYSLLGCCNNNARLDSLQTTETGPARVFQVTEFLSLRLAWKVQRSLMGSLLEEEPHSRCLYPYDTSQRLRPLNAITFGG